jgi:hypothetical protein
MADDDDDLYADDDHCIYAADDLNDDDCVCRLAMGSPPAPKGRRSKIIE